MLHNTTFSIHVIMETLEMNLVKKKKHTRKEKKYNSNLSFLGTNQICQNL